MGPDPREEAGIPGRRPGGGRLEDPRGRPDRSFARSQSPHRSPTMTASLPRIIDAFSGLEVLVIGEAILDAYLEGSTGRLCREAPVPIVDLTARREAPGGAANSAVNA